VLEIWAEWEEDKKEYRTFETKALKIEKKNNSWNQAKDNIKIKLRRTAYGSGRFLYKLKFNLPRGYESHVIQVQSSSTPWLCKRAALNDVIAWKST
jgi:hypothetical protein